MRLRSLLACAALAAASFPAAADPSYRVIDLMPDYWAFEARAQAVAPDARAALFRTMVAARHPEAYAPGVIGLPPELPYGEALDQRHAQVASLLEGRTALMRRLSASIASDLPRYEAQFRRTFPDLAWRGDIYFMHSLGGFDGGTRTVGGRTALLFGIDMIAYVYGEDIDPQPFFHHELFHVYHAQFLGTGEEGREDPLVHALWREGLATYVAQALNPSASGVSVFGLPRSTPARARAMLPRLAAELRARLDSTSADDRQRFFSGSKEDAATPARSGYYLGFLVARELAKGRSLVELAHQPVAQLRPGIEAALDRIAAGGVSP